MPSVPRRVFATFVGLTVLVVFLQSITAGEFISQGLPGPARHTWTDVHGLLAYPIMVFALVAAVVVYGLAIWLSVRSAALRRAGHVRPGA